MLPIDPPPTPIFPACGGLLECFYIFSQPFPQWWFSRYSTSRYQTDCAPIRAAFYVPVHKQENKLFCNCISGTSGIRRLLLLDCYQLREPKEFITNFRLCAWFLRNIRKLKFPGAHVVRVPKEHKKS